MTIDQHYMTEALKEAKKAFAANEVPVGAVIVYKGRIIARAHNQIIMLRDPTAHAEMIALTQAAAHLENERLLDTTVYATIEPCPMCAGAMVLGRVKRLVYGASDPKAGAAGSVIQRGILMSTPSSLRTVRGSSARRKAVITSSSQPTRG